METHFAAGRFRMGTERRIRIHSWQKAVTDVQLAAVDFSGPRSRDVEELFLRGQTASPPEKETKE
ncbi:hypothetical protein AB0B89_26350 [Sphaerisporangium sp. NPDC049002]|uniref:hypothetical protein n=1 Tax=unclassified Sphaerisporangium TaxID=2630420 RepID=UPI00340AD7B8